MRRSVDLAFTLLVAALVSFCSMGYELLIARLLVSLTADAVLAQSLTVGCFLLALGLGAFSVGRLEIRRHWIFLANLEIILAVVACFAVPAIAIASLQTGSPWKLIVGSQLVTLVIGFLSGAELPVLIEIAKPRSKRAFGWVLAANYIGALVVSIALPQALVPTLGLYTLSWTLALLTALAAGLAFIRSFEFKPSLTWPGMALVLVLPPALASRQDVFEQFYLKSYYYVRSPSLLPSEIEKTREIHSDLPRVMRLSSPYQEIDVVRDDMHLFGLTEGGDDFHLFIDQKNQFGSHTEAIYHNTMVHAGINLARTKPAKALVIGGGDGLIVRDLLRYPEVKAITLVELDPAMIRLANTYPALRELNRGALQDPRVTVVTADGFEWLRREGERFDAIFIDLPHPNSVDLSRLYSAEFYRFAKRRLAGNGFVVVDFPASSLLKSERKRNTDAVASLVETLHAGGFGTVAGFGFWESFLIATPDERKFEFDYDALDPYVDDIAVFNMALIELPKTPARANSIFRPMVLKVSFDGGS